MLVSAVSIMGSMLLSWGTSYFNNKQLVIANQLANRTNYVMENYVVEDAWFYTKSGTNYANVTIRDTGSTGITVSNIYVNNTQQWSGSQKIAAGNYATIPVPDAWQSGRPQNIWVHTAAGTDVKQVWLPY
jgi:archaellum component FlaF (FlaF/FlaG flagellin family)